MNLREKGRCRRVVKDFGEREKEGGRIKRARERRGGNKNSTRGRGKERVGIRDKRKNIRKKGRKEIEIKNNIREQEKQEGGEGEVKEEEVGRKKGRGEDGEEEEK